MDYTKFTNGWDLVCKRMNVRLSDEYISWNARDMKIDLWEEKIVLEVFDDISRMNPKNLDLSAGEIKRLYWSKFHEYNRQKIMNDVRIECKQGLCDGTGLIHAKLCKDSILTGDGLPNAKATRDYYNYIFRCDCSLGIGNASQALQWKDRRKERIYKIDPESIYKDEETGRYNLAPQISYITKSMGIENSV